MPRMRTLKPGFFSNDRLAEIPPLGRLLFQGLWCMADREGRLEDRPKRIKAEVLPYDNCNVEKMLEALAERGFIIRYASGGDRFIQVTNFSKHQNPHQKEPASSIPAPEEHSASMVQASGQSDASTVSAPEEPCSPNHSLSNSPNHSPGHGWQPQGSSASPVQVPGVREFVPPGLPAEVASRLARPPIGLVSENGSAS